MDGQNVEHSVKEEEKENEDDEEDERGMQLPLFSGIGGSLEDSIRVPRLQDGLGEELSRQRDGEKAESSGTDGRCIF